MKIVLTNDDGFGALGIETVKEILKEFGDGFVFAPSTPQSGMSCGFTTYRKPITVCK
ncbi:MAG: 5'/3'-nucleotidase SurE, partial [Clostridiales bacterium]|nr:5'/3'-nucleotidase SurE [Clostridiales bacterium]